VSAPAITDRITEGGAVVRIATFRVDRGWPVRHYHPLQHCAGRAVDYYRQQCEGGVKVVPSGVNVKRGVEVV
jgi:hypothetical protein